MKKVAVLNFHPAFTPPKSGGELRYWNLMTRLSQSFDVRMINPTFGEAQREEIAHTPTCIETRIPKSRRYNAWHHFFDRHAKFPECSALVSTLAVKSHKEYLELARREALSADAVIFSSPFMGHIYPRRRAGQVIIYDSYNIESRLAREVLGSGFWGKWGTRRVAKIEGNLARRADLILVCSEEDGNEMRELYKLDGSQIVCIPNGVDIDAIQPADATRRLTARNRLALSGNRRAILFIGSFHPPNIESVEFIVRELAPNLPGADFLVAGKVCEAFANRTTPDNVRLLGIVSDETRGDLLAGCDVALNPMFSGSGTNLKMLDFFAAGLPTITTPVGARGLRVTHGDHAMVIESPLFLQCVRDMIADEERRARLRSMSRRHAEDNFSWRMIGDRFRRLMELKTSRRIIVLNDFPVTPVNSGGRARLEAVARHLSEKVAPVTVLTLTKEPRGRHNMLARHCEEINVPRSNTHNVIDMLMAARTGRIAVDDITATIFWRFARNFRRRLQRETQWASTLVLSHCYMINFARQHAGQIPVVYEAYNVEAVLKRSVFPRDSFGRWLLRKVENAEHIANTTSVFTSCVSEADRSVFEKEFGIPHEKLVIAQNGVDCEGRAQTKATDRPRLRAAIGMGRETAALFLGSGHPPNRDAVTYLVQEVAPANRRVVFLIAGTVCGWFYNKPIPENIILLGEITNETKEFLLQACDIALNPLFDGSGSSLKVPEYLSAGIPVISTEIGARGFATNGTDAMLICDHRDLPEQIDALANDSARRTELAENGRRLAEQHFDWAVTLKPLDERLRKLNN